MDATVNTAETITAERNSVTSLPESRPTVSLASRLAQYLPNKRILLIEAGPSDFMNDRVLKLKNWLSLLGGDFDFNYGTTEQPMGMFFAAGAANVNVIPQARHGC